MKALPETLEGLLELLPACIDTGKDAPFNHYWLQIQKRSAAQIQYLVAYVGDTYTTEEVINPIAARVYMKAFAEDLAQALTVMAHMLEGAGFL